MRAAGSVPNTALPATKILAPASKTSLYIGCADAAVYLYVCRKAPLVTKAFSLLLPFRWYRDELLSAKARINGHDQNYVHLIQNMFQHRNRSRRI